ncbi:MAG: hypothetical protein RLZZ481_829 [Pseudomonadota bacterium]|jgi:hypothetical protein
MTLREQLQQLHAEHPEGLTIPQLMKITGKVNSQLFMVMKRGKGFYVAEWVQPDPKYKHQALWKWSDVPIRDKPRPLPKSQTGETKEYHRVYMREYRRTHGAKTVIRGPWVDSEGRPI